MTSNYPLFHSPASVRLELGKDSNNATKRNEKIGKPTNSLPFENSSEAEQHAQAGRKINRKVYMKRKTSRILSLNIHEELTFESAGKSGSSSVQPTKNLDESVPEIALHPSCFHNPIELFHDISIGETNYETNTVQDGSDNLLSTRKKANTPRRNIDIKSSHKARSIEDISNEHLELTYASGKNSTSRLQVGDLIEIRAWEPKYEQNINATNTSYYNRPTDIVCQTTVPSSSQNSAENLELQRIITKNNLPSKGSFVDRSLVDIDGRSKNSVNEGIKDAKFIAKVVPSNFGEGTKSSPTRQQKSHHEKNENKNHSEEEQEMESKLFSSFNLKQKFLMKINSKSSFSTIKENARYKISLLKQVADLYELSPYEMVTVTHIQHVNVPHSHPSNIRSTEYWEDEEGSPPIIQEEAIGVSADHVMITIRDQFISRGQMFQISSFLRERWLYEGYRYSSKDSSCVRFTANEIRHENHNIKSGIITKNTKIAFRSRSARVVWLIQISAELWEYSSPYRNPDSSTKNNESPTECCHIYFDKFVNFLYRLFEKWKSLEVKHSLTVIFFSRTYLTSQRTSTQPGNNFGNVSGSSPCSSNMNHSASGSAIYEDIDGRRYEDNYEVVIENETRSDWESLVFQIKKQFVSYPSRTGWNFSPESGRLPSTAGQGNVLEAINVTLNLLSLHFMDRDLHRTGNSIVLVSAGCGVFEVDKGLADLTKQRMMDNGIGSDMLSLSLPPLHVAPFFLYKDVAGPSADEMHGFDDWKTYFEVPHWMHLSFVDYDHDASNLPKKQADLNEVEGGEFSLIGANGFVLHHPKSQANNLDIGSVGADIDSVAALSSHPNKQGSGFLSRSNVAWRDFEDILEACRPRSRVDSISGIPSALTAIILRSTTFVPQNIPKQLAKGEEDTEKLAPTPQSYSTPKTTEYPEWGTLKHDFRFQDTSLVNNSVHLNRNNGSDASSPSSSFASTYSHLLSRSPGLSTSYKGNGISFRGIEIQPSSSLEIVTNPDMHGTESGVGGLNESNSCGKSMHDKNQRQSEESLLSIAGQDNNRTSQSDIQVKVSIPTSPRIFRPSSSIPLEDLRSLMEKYDSSITSCSSLNTNISPAAIQRFEKHGTNTQTVKGGGIGALVQTNILGNHTEREHDSGDVPRRYGQGIGKHSAHVAHQEATSQYVKNKNLDYRSVLSGFSTDQQNMTTDRSKKISQSEVKNRRNESKSTSRVIEQKKMNTVPSKSSRQKRWVLNPFRQQDEEEILAKRSYNRRRWSHVFPLGEVEFKRQAGPNWKSLCQPAVLPLTIDYHPSQKELSDSDKYQFNHYEIMLDAMNTLYYKTHKELLFEMCLQRLIQDYQVIPQEIVKKSRSQGGSERKVATTFRKRMPLLIEERQTSNVSPDVKNLKYTLSMGHNIHDLSIGPNSDVIKVVQYIAKFTQNNSRNKSTYHYMLWMPFKQKFQKVNQTFTKVDSSSYPWNKFDMQNVEEPSSALSEGTRYRCLRFCIIPDSFTEGGKEQEYIQKFMRLLDYFKKLQQKDHNEEMDIRILPYFDDKDQSEMKQSCYTVHAKHFHIQLKGAHEKYEWIDLALDEFFYTKRTYHIGMHWLVASGSKVDAQVQLFKRRCSQFGLVIIPFPQYAANSNLNLNPFIAPDTIIVRDQIKSDQLELLLKNELDFIQDSDRRVRPIDLDHLPDFDCRSKLNRGGTIVARQYVHITGVAFVRVIQNCKNHTAFFWVKNGLQDTADEDTKSAAFTLFHKWRDFVSSFQLP